MNENLSSKPKLTILLSINAAAILIAGVLIASAIWFNGGLQFRVVGERSDIVEDDIGEMALLESVSESNTSSKNSIDYQEDHASYSDNIFGHTPVSDGELWDKDAVTIYATPDTDICVGGNLSDLGEMYWQTSNTNIIAGFHNTARTWLGFDSETCKYPIISGIGTTTITAGTYDGKRKDSIIVTVIAPPKEQWKHEVLSLVNSIRTKNHLNQLSWGYTCESAADLRAFELETLYSHTRPDGSDWSTVCESPTAGGISGENLAVGNAAVSPATTVSLWMNSDSHRANILNPEYTKLAVGFNFDLNTEYKTHWSQFFSTY